MAMQTNESIIAVPITVEQSGQTRQFLVRLVEKLDVVLGRRGGDPYVVTSQLIETVAGLTKLEAAIFGIIERLLSVEDTELLEGVITATNEAIEELKSNNTVANADTSIELISGPPTKSEVEAVDAKVAANAVKFNDLLTVLRGTGIIAT